MAGDTYLQDFSKIYTEADGAPLGRIDSVAIAGHSLWCTHEGVLWTFNGRAWTRTDAEIPCYRVMSTSSGRVALISDDQITFVLADGSRSSIPMGSRIRACCAGLDTVIVAADDRLLSINADGEIRVICAGIQDVRELACHPSGELIVASDGERLVIVQGEKQIELELDPAPGSVNALLCDASGHIWVGTDRGLIVINPLQEARWLRGCHGVPIENVTCIAEGSDGSLWIGGAIGVARLHEGQWRFYPYRRWIPAKQVTAIAVGSGGDAWVGTINGLAHIWFERMSLERKAEIFERRIAARHNRMGYVASCHLAGPGDVANWTHYASDNDGLWTSIYIAAESFRYAATGDETARENAAKSMKALLWLEKVTPIDGFVARAAVRKGEKVDLSHGEWHETPDGQWLWKGDTSSDEIDGHFFAFGIYYDLVASQEEKKEIANTAERIMRYIIQNRFLLIDIDGQPTTWGVWNPEWLNSKRWWEEKGLNSLELLAYLKTTFHVTGKREFEDVYRKVIRDHGYAVNTIFQKITVPGHVNHSDDELAFLAYFSLLRYETDPALRRIFLLSLERSWQIERPERLPIWNLMYGALTGKPCDVDEAIAELRNIPMDTIEWYVDNTGRADIELDEFYDRHDRPQSKTALRAHERPMLKWNGNPYVLVGGGNGTHEDDGAFFLLAYWLGRYYGLIPA